MPVDLLDTTTAALIALADDDLAVGHVLTSVAGFGPDLEINIALSSMGQDELGHVRAYYSLALGQDRDAINEAIFARPAEEYRAAPLSWVYGEAWETLAVKSFLYETADAERRAALAGGRRDDVRDAVARMEGEERYHLDFWMAWLAQTVDRGDRARTKAQAAVDALWGPAQQLFTMASADELVDGGFAAVSARWAANAGAHLESLGLAVPVASDATVDVVDRDRILDELRYVYRDAPGRW
jgi:ring-1,2-phenylacetyl-CoA epoxidase subunit PaaC